MAININSRPDDFGSAYTPVEYTLTSTFAGQSSTIANIYLDPSTGFTALKTNLSKPRAKIQPDGILTISNTGGEYDGDWIVQANATGEGSTSGGVVLLDAPYTIDVTGGNMDYNRLGAQVWADLYVDGSFIVRKKRFPNSNDQFVFNFDKEIQIGLGNDMKPLAIGGSTAVVNPEGSASIYIEYTDVQDIITNGIAVQRPSLGATGNFSTDVANPRTIINSTVPYLEWLLGSVRSEIVNKDTDLSSFVVTASSTARFLTNSPKTISIGTSDAYELSAIIDYDAAISYAMEIEYFDAAGASDGTVYVTVSATTDSVWRFEVGTRGVVGAVKPSTSVSYTIAIVDRNNADLKISETITFEIDSKCHASDTRFVWLNPRGGYDAFTFHSPRKLNSSVQKKSFKPARQYPVVVGNAEESILDVNAQDNITTSTNKVTKSVAEWMQELLESPQVFIELDDSNALHDKRIPVVIVNKTRAIANSYSGTFNVALRYRFAFEKVGIRAV